MTGSGLERRWTAALLPAGIALAVYAAALFALGREAASHDGGTFTYALDDPYIHMAIARTLAESGTWGITPGVFASASSSPLWTLLLAASFAVFGVHETIPFGWNVFCGALAIVLSAVLLARHRVRRPLAIGVLLALVLATPLPLLAFEGLEHSLQLALDLAFVAAAARWLSDETRSATASRALLVLAPLVASVRYEGAFFVAAACGLGVLRGRWRAAFGLAAVGAAPLVAFGVYSLAHGGFFLPNPVLLKSRSLGALPANHDAAAFIALVTRGGNALLRAPHLLVPLLASAGITALALQRNTSPWRLPVVANALVVFVALAHVQFAGMGWLYRYESYLVALALIWSAVGFAELRSALGRSEARSGDRALRAARVAAAVVCVGVGGYPLLDRARSAWVAVPRAVGNIYEQQAQMARFVSEQWSGRAIAANDIGAISLRATASPLLDLAGLASIDVARLHLASRFDRESMERVVREHGVSLVLIYDTWFEGSGIPETWQRVGRWTIRDRVAASHDTVSLYGVGPQAAAELADALGRFAPSLPASVRQRGVYRGAEPDDAVPVSAAPAATLRSPAP